MGPVKRASRYESQLRAQFQAALRRKLKAKAVDAPRSEIPRASRYEERLQGRFRAALLQKLKVTSLDAPNAKSTRANASKTVDQAPFVVQQPVLKKKPKPEPKPPPPLPSSFARNAHKAPNAFPASLRRQQPVLATASTQKAKVKPVPVSNKKPKPTPVPASIAKPKRTRERPNFASIEALRAILGVGPHSDATGRDVVLIAIDTESEPSSFGSRVAEIGVATLRVRDVLGVAPGGHLGNWIAKMSHHHIVLDFARKPKQRMAGSLFGRSQSLTATDAHAALRSILRSCTTDKVNAAQTDQQPASEHSPALDAILVGQGIRSDIIALAGPGVQLDVYDPNVMGVQFKTTFDTTALTATAIQRGAQIPSAKLGPLVAHLGVEPKFIEKTRRRTVTVVGTHNASNDAAYTMMALLFYATRWEEIIEGAAQEPAGTAEAETDMLGKPKADLARRLKHQEAEAVVGARSWWKQPTRLLGSMLATVAAGSGVSLLGRSATLNVPPPDHEKENS
ncbi:hypothetical protein LTR36_000315 [Oleoguttula mirabilis]|uniref:Gfd2/YDR514C-like C-terminal domain-containing protein n=1 Tax=Oleoguttula mirabilis TaxID=1507867 RepID=A0AAV9JYS0_9PEZI|nr:hypothetical protein LTR36_000315 [Oleoguttula mirabilis]